MGPEAKNLEAISKAIDQHNSSCPWPASEVRMNPFEIERLGWEEIRGLPSSATLSSAPAVFASSARATSDGELYEQTEAIGTQVEVGVGTDAPPLIPPV